MAAFPTTAQAVTSDWLEARLKAAGVMGEGRVVAASFVPIGTGQVGDTARFTLAYDRAGAGPATVAGKFASADVTSRSTAAMLGLYAKEVHFYRELAQRVAVRCPQVHASELSEDGATFLLLFEDLGPARGGNQLDGCGIAEARLGVIQAAAWDCPIKDLAYFLGCGIGSAVRRPYAISTTAISSTATRPTAAAFLRSHAIGVLSPQRRSRRIAVEHPRGDRARPWRACRFCRNAVGAAGRAVAAGYALAGARGADDCGARWRAVADRDRTAGAVSDARAGLSDEEMEPRDHQRGRDRYRGVRTADHRAVCAAGAEGLFRSPLIPGAMIAALPPSPSGAGLTVFSPARSAPPRPVRSRRRPSRGCG